MSRPEEIVAITRLAARVHTWSAECDRRLIRLFDFLHDRIDLKLFGSLASSDTECCEIWVWPDADLAGDKLFSTKSTSGRFIEVVGDLGRSLPLHWATHKQGASSLSTPEAENVSLSDALKADALAIQSLFSLILERPITLRVFEDNTVTISSVEKGYSQVMRYLSRTQRTSLGFNHEVFYELEDEEVGDVILQYGPTKEHKGDFFTKDTLSAAEYEAALEGIGMFSSLEKFQRGERILRAGTPQERARLLAESLYSTPQPVESGDG